MCANQCLEWRQEFTEICLKCLFVWESAIFSFCLECCSMCSVVIVGTGSVVEPKVSSWSLKLVVQSKSKWDWEYRDTFRVRNRGCQFENSFKNTVDIFISGMAGADPNIPRLSFSAALRNPMVTSGTIIFDEILVNEGDFYNPRTGNLGTAYKQSICIYTFACIKNNVYV